MDVVGSSDVAAAEFVAVVAEAAAVAALGMADVAVVDLRIETEQSAVFEAGNVEIAVGFVAAVVVFDVAAAVETVVDFEDGDRQWEPPSEVWEGSVPGV